MGDKQASVILILFSDFECPFCKEFQKKTIPKLKTKYIDKGLLCIYYKHFPLDFHEGAFPAAKAAYAASLQGKFGKWQIFLYLQILAPNQYDGPHLRIRWYS